MDFESLKQGLTAITMTIATLKQAKDLLPDGGNKKQISENIEQAERQLKIAEAQIAQSMGYELCKNHFPPEIMLSKGNKIWECPVCGNEIKPVEPKKFKHPLDGYKGL